MEQATVEYHDGDYNVTIVVQQATVRMGWHRATLIAQYEGQLKQLPADEQADLATRYTVYRTLPELMAATLRIKNGKDSKRLDKNISLKEWFELPEALVMVWEQAVYKINPHWVVKPVETKEGEESPGEAPKPEDNLTSTNGSSPG